MGRAIETFTDHLGTLLSRTHLGRVIGFDPDRALGTIEFNPANSSLGPIVFHALSISDGSRFIENAQDVTFQVLPGQLGIWEATDVVKI